MIYSIIVSRQAGKDAERLDRRLMEYGPASLRSSATCLSRRSQAWRNMLRGVAPVGPTTREINLPFGQSAYVIRYRVTVDRVIVTRIWHGREFRRR